MGGRQGTPILDWSQILPIEEKAEEEGLTHGIRQWPEDDLAHADSLEYWWRIGDLNEHSEVIRPEFVELFVRALRQAKEAGLRG